MKRICCSHDDMTNKHLEVMAWCLAKYFGHTEETATGAVERYYNEWKGIHDDDVYQHEGSYWMALRVHFVEDLGSPGDFHLWRVAHGYRDVPPEAGEYWYQHCFNGEPDSN